MKTLGIIGGFGPETTAKFYMSIVNKNRKINKSHPNVLIHNVPVPFDLENDAVRHAKNLEKFLPLLLDSVKILQDKADLIALPCNTLHIFMDDISAASKKPIVSIIDETVEEVKKRKLKRVGILATSTTINEGVFESMFLKNSVSVVKPSDQSQLRLSEIICNILQGKKSSGMRSILIAIINCMKAEGAEAIILACTDLQLLIKQTDTDLMLIDTMDVLANSVVNEINQSRW